MATETLTFDAFKMDDLMNVIQKDIDSFIEQQDEYRQSLCHVERLRQAQMAFLEEHEEIRVRNEEMALEMLSAHELGAKQNSPTVRRSHPNAWDVSEQKSYVVNHHPRLDHQGAPRSAWIYAKTCANSGAVDVDEPAACKTERPITTFRASSPPVRTSKQSGRKASALSGGTSQISVHSNPPLASPSDARPADKNVDTKPNCFNFFDVLDSDSDF
eukprot:GEMP01059340.1.p1 GENE.GEMP01059340.1~~GEMP01059340.1.p1  ORF type:complete len:215 (+),score=45.91 GEMP01059340.1:160-804(+)